VRLLVTRPAADGERTAERLRALGHEVLLAPLLQVQMLPDAQLGAGPWAAVAMTSANAVPVVHAHARGAELSALPAYVVGRRTAAAARTAGFADVTSADGGVDDLVRLLAARLCAGAVLLYLAGEDRAGDLAGGLAPHGVRVTTAVVYRAARADRLPDAVQAALAAGALDGALHFSRRSVEVYLDGARLAGVLDKALAPFHYCLSQQVAEPLLAAGASKVRVAVRPEEAVLIELAVSS
jgi:uroporphyrinogen-III synthase